MREFLSHRSHQISGTAEASAREHYFFMNDVPLAVTDGQGNALPVSDCPLDVVECGSTWYRACRKVRFPEGATYHLNFGPTDATSAIFADRGISPERTRRISSFAR